MELNRLTVQLQPECQPETCNQMSATDQWIFLCAAHKAPKECPAIDYTRHTLDGAAALLNSNKYFPSRVTIKESSVAKLASVCRRVYRIFSHAYYHHKPIYDWFESATSLCKRFSVFAIKYDLMSVENLIVPIPGVDYSTIATVASSSSVVGGGQAGDNTTTKKITPLADSGSLDVSATTAAIADATILPGGEETLKGETGSETAPPLPAPLASGLDAGGTSSGDTSEA